MKHKPVPSIFRRKRKAFILTPLVFILLLIGCSAGDDSARLETEPYFTGFITEIRSVGDGETLTQILVESHADKIVDKYRVTLAEKTTIFRQDGDNYQEAAPTDLKNQQVIQLWFTGPIMESFPVQATARQIVITDQQVEIADVPAPEPTPTPAAKPTSYPEPPPMTIDTGNQFTATIETEKGNLVLELFAREVPVTVNNFVFLAREGFYDGTKFHRIIADFMAQAGDPEGTGYGGPGYSFADEFTSRTHVTGALSMANSGPNTNGSQFFITYSPQHHLDNIHSVFGQLTEGMDVLKSLNNGDALLRIVIEER